MKSKIRMSSLGYALLAIFIAFLMVGCVPLDARPIYSGNISGRITDSVTSRPIYNALVSMPLIGLSTHSNQAGYYTLPFSNLEGGTYSFQVSHTGHNLVSTTVFIDRAYVTKDVSMSRSYGVSGYAYNVLTSAPFVSEPIKFTHTSPGPISPVIYLTITTDYAGFYYASPSQIGVGIVVVIGQKQDYYFFYRSIPGFQQNTVYAYDVCYLPNHVENMVIAGIFIHTSSQISDLTWRSEISTGSQRSIQVQASGSVGQYGVGSSWSESVGSTFGGYSDNYDSVELYQRVVVSGQLTYDSTTGKLKIIENHTVGLYQNCAPLYVSGTYCPIQDPWNPTWTGRPSGGDYWQITNGGTCYFESKVTGSSQTVAGFDVSGTISSGLISGNLFSMSCKRSETSDTTTELKVSFNHSGNHVHQAYVYWQDTHLGKLIAHVYISAVQS
jgi:hypothetical protein